MKPHFEIPPPPQAHAGPATDLHDSVAKLPTHVQTDDDPLSVLFEAGQRIELKTGDWLFRLGDTGRRLFVVRSGSLDVVVQGVDGHEQTLGRFGPGGVFGEVSFLLGGGRSASARVWRSISRRACSTSKASLRLKVVSRAISRRSLPG